LARLLLKIDDAKNRGTNPESRYTINGIATKSVMLSRMDFEKVEKYFYNTTCPMAQQLNITKM
jgi:hypothetical protein